MLQVVLHLNEEAKWATVINNGKNLLALAPDALVKVVVNGPAVSGYFSPEMKETFASLKKQGMAFYACQQALKSQGRLASELPSEIETVP